jgi:hypothetical protein
MGLGQRKSVRKPMANNEQGSNRVTSITTGWAIGIRRSVGGNGIDIWALRFMTGPSSLQSMLYSHRKTSSSLLSYPNVVLLSSLNPKSNSPRPLLLAVVQFECGTRILRVIHGRDARATSPKMYHYPSLKQFAKRSCNMKNLKTYAIAAALIFVVATLVFSSRLIHAQEQEPSWQGEISADKKPAQVTVHVSKQDWEYQVISLKASEPGSSLQNRLNGQGAQGWEIVGISGNLIIFKRPR